MDIWNDLTDAIGKDMAVSEMNKKYLNTYLSLIGKDGKKIIVQYLGHYTDDDTHHFADALNTKIKLKHDTKYQLVCEFPERRLFNSGKLALEFVRKPTRQYKRGICKDNCQIYSPVRRMWSGDGYAWTIKTLEDALSPEYPTCTEAITKLDRKEVVSVALSPKFMMSLSFTYIPEYYLFYSNVVIGSFKDGVFKIHHKLFNQEVLDNIDIFKPYKVEF